jgi:hypothetical protein
MSWREILNLLAATMLVIVAGSVVLATRPGMHHVSQTLWAIAIILSAGVLGYLAVTLAFEFF